MEYKREEQLVLNSLANAFEDEMGTVNNPKTTRELVEETGIGQEASCKCKYAQNWRMHKVRDAISGVRNKGHFIFNESFTQRVFDLDNNAYKILRKRGWYIPTEDKTIKRIIDKGKKVYRGVGSYVKIAQKLEQEIKEKGRIAVVQEQRQMIAKAIAVDTS